MIIVLPLNILELFTKINDVNCQVLRVKYLEADRLLHKAVWRLIRGWSQWYILSVWERIHSFQTYSVIEFDCHCHLSFIYHFLFHRLIRENYRTVMPGQELSANLFEESHWKSLQQ